MDAVLSSIVTSYFLLKKLFLSSDALLASSDAFPANTDASSAASYLSSCRVRYRVSLTVSAVMAPTFSFVSASNAMIKTVARMPVEMSILTKIR